MGLKIEDLQKKHNRKDFSCGKILLDTYINKQASQDVKRNLSTCFVLVEDTDHIVKGYFTLSSGSIRRQDIPEDLAKKLPWGYEDMPTALLGRLAIDNSLKGQRWGERLLLEALERCLGISEMIGTLAVVVDPIDDEAQNFYKKYGFILLPTSGKMFLPIKTIKDLYKYK
ncbi:GNAT family N-acetyltransferase [Arachidicoccus ginsenosidivorans]|jgi:ribosomal protein S18 acetylase RimI-like enzyme|uniref:GNAT family N-acetyltransferase n=1 Tax=Arachidicoccus ginsenosidivorans TaxID=496057 RepID=A0A5B8VHI4_9BACT|nr:GNAT family N-acetyltransferase [Arachidicoccus ginsenosidivorans]QEC70633.1 GNAT family N-acetyltransferase [Arachidicoccus ginsenosidivorans]